MALTQDVHAIRYGAPGNSTQPNNKPMNAGITVYRGSIALCDNTGNIKNASSPASTDTCWGLIGDVWSGSDVSNLANIWGNGITSPSGAAGQISIEIDTGSFYLASSTGADAITEANVGETCYVYNETTVALTSDGGTRPAAGVIMNYDATLGIGVKLGPVAGTTGGPS